MKKDTIPAIPLEECERILNNIVQSVAKQFQYTVKKYKYTLDFEYVGYDDGENPATDCVGVSKRPSMDEITIFAMKRDASAAVTFARSDDGYKFRELAVEGERGIKWAKLIIKMYKAYARNVPKE